MVWPLNLYTGLPLFMIMSTTKFHANIREIFPEKKNLNLKEFAVVYSPPPFKGPDH